jgi:dihydroxyacid dehydratase/phosphogluconate dehydratase
MGKPQVGISSMWYEGNPCNMHLLTLAEHVKAGVVSTHTHAATAVRGTADQPA